MIKVKIDAEFADEIWSQNYMGPDDTSRDDMYHRLALNGASIEKEEIRKEIEDKFYFIMDDDKFVPGGRIQANLGVKSRGATTLMNCYLDSTTDTKAVKNFDSISGIYKMLERQAQTLKSEGGYGTNFSYIRPNGAYVRGIGSRTPGVLKFMELWDKSSEIITMGSTNIIGETKKDEKKKIRKGAQMGVLSCFSDNTQILTTNGWVNILDVISSTIPLYAVCEDGIGYLIKNPVINEPEQLFEVEAEDGTIIEVTGNHEFEVMNIETNEVYLKKIKDVNPDIEMMKIITLDVK